VRDEREVMCEGDRCDQKINGRHFDAIPPKLNPNLFERVGTVSIIFQQAQLSE
jgi:hypothetical protein